MNEIQKRKNLKKRKLLLVIPIFMISFATVFYLAITAGNKFQAITSKHDSTHRAFNIKLPSANLKGGEKNKLEIYMQAQEDSLKRKESYNKDPYEKSIYDPLPLSNQVNSTFLRPTTHSLNALALGSVDPNERKVNERLQKLYSVLNQKTENGTSEIKESVSPLSHSDEDSGSAHEIEKLLSGLQEGSNNTDPEMKHIEKVLDKVLEIQHPDRFKDLDSASNALRKKFASEVTTQPQEDSWSNSADSTNFNIVGGSVNSFYGLEGDLSESSNRDSGTILAVIHGDQLVHDGGKARLRLQQDIFIGRVRIPKDNFIYGICAIGTERVNIRIDNISVNNIIYPIHLTAYSSDGMEGIDVPGAVGQEAGKEGLNQALQNIELFNADPSIGTQAAGAAVQTVKSLANKKVKQVYATLKSGQTVLLRNTH